MITPKNTKTPWKTSLYSDGMEVLDSRGFRVTVCRGHEYLANAELIVRAVNAHEQITAALETLIERMEYHAKWAKDDALRGHSCGTIKAIIEEHDGPEFSARQAINSARAALRAARGEA